MMIQKIWKIILASLVLGTICGGLWIFLRDTFFLVLPSESESRVIMQNESNGDDAKDTIFINEDDFLVQKERDVSISDDHARIIRILFGGDMNFDRYIRTKAQHNGYDAIFSQIKNVIDEHDCMIANLEGPITEHASVSQYSKIGTSENYRFTFEPVVADVLAAHRVCAVNIGNNHIGNFGREGIDRTKELLDERGIAYIADTGDPQEIRSRIIDMNGVHVGLVNYNAFVEDAYEHTLTDIADVRSDSDIVIVYAHWGVEYQSTARQAERVIAQTCIDAGADLVIGSHPHVIQNSEEYKGKKIYYSLGNFIFDQYFRPETMQGMLVSVTYDADHDIMSFREYAITMESTGITRLSTN